jgi:hypothetical protein
MDEIIDSDFDFDLDIEINAPYEPANPRDADPLCHPRYDLYQDFRMGGLGALMNITLPVSTHCVDMLDCYVNQQRDCVTLDYMGLHEHGDRQICMRLHRYREKAYWEDATHSWLSSEPEFAQVTEIIRKSVAAGEAPLWNLARVIDLPEEVIAALTMGISGDVMCPGLMKPQFEVAILIGFCSVDLCLAAMGCAASQWVPVRRHAQRIRLRAQREMLGGAQ